MTVVGYFSKSQDGWKVSFTELRMVIASHFSGVAISFMQEVPVFIKALNPDSGDCRVAALLAMTH